jgi:hypothetical protein
VWCAESGAPIFVLVGELQDQNGQHQLGFAVEQWRPWKMLQTPMQSLKL